MLIGCYNVSVILTYLGVACSVVGILFADKLKFALVLLMIAGICDMFDGVIARKCKRNDKAKAFGFQIDSLCDVVNFVMFPIVLVYSMMNTASGGSISMAWYKIYFIIVAIAYVLAGLIRLAWFNITSSEMDSPKYYSGLPVTFISMILPLVYVLTRYMSVHKIAILITMVITALLFVLDVPIRKPKGWWYLFFLLMGVGITTFLFVG